MLSYGADVENHFRSEMERQLLEIQDAFGIYRDDMERERRDALERERATERQRQDAEDRLRETEHRRQDLEDQLRETENRRQDLEDGLHLIERQKQDAEDRLRETEWRRQMTENQLLETECRLWVLQKTPSVRFIRFLRRSNPFGSAKERMR